MKVNECMSTNVIYAKPEDTICNVAKLMENNHIGCVPVCDNNDNVVGLVTDRDLILRSIACDKDIKNTHISEIMSTNVFFCTSNSDITNVTNLMSENQIRRIPVIDNNKLVGIVSLGDIIRKPEVTQNQVCNTAECICKNDQNSKNNE